MTKPATKLIGIRAYPENQVGKVKTTGIGYQEGRKTMSITAPAIQ
jgi:hypothetical protein